MPRPNKTSEKASEPTGNETSNAAEMTDEAGVCDSASQPPRRSARLMKRQRDNENTEETEGTAERNLRGRNEGNSRVNTRNTESSEASEASGTTGADESATVPESAPTSNPSASASTSTSTVTGPVMMPIVFSIGLSRTQPSPSVSPDIHWIFNTGGNPSSEEVQQLIRNSTTGNVNNGNPRLRSASFVIPLTSATVTNRFGPRASTDAPANQSIPASFNLLNFARQMSQFVARFRSSPLESGDAEDAQSFREFMGSIVNLMNDALANSDNSDSGPSIVRIPEGSLSPDDLESLLSGFFAQAFGNMESVPTGLTPERINALHVLEKDDTEFDCAICRETAKAGVDKCVKLPCDHEFHFDCIEPWLKRVSSCPICRSVIKE